jgi:superfamily II DNA helicase RecQ
MINYANHINELEFTSFESIRNVAFQSISHLDQKQRDDLWDQLGRGISLLSSHEQMCAYLYFYGPMHQAKLLEAFQHLPTSLFEKPFDIIDWGCGQAMGTINLFDFLDSKGINNNVRNITLIEPSQAALERGFIHTKAYLSDDVEVKSINKYFHTINKEEIINENPKPVIHIFSNILDVEQIDLKHLSSLIDSSLTVSSYLVCVGPLNPNNTRIDAFFNYFNHETINKLYEYQCYGFKRRNWTYKAKVYRLDLISEGHLNKFQHYPNVQFQAAYQIDCIRNSFNYRKEFYKNRLSSFNVSALYDVGAIVYTNVHPILAVLNNIICRGLPTRSSVYVENKMSILYNFDKLESNLAGITFNNLNPCDFNELEKLYDSFGINKSNLSTDELNNIQLLLTPIAISRFHKVLIEALISKRLSLDSKNWKILVEEKDVPFAAIAIEDFIQMFKNLKNLSSDYSDLVFPKVELTVISNESFIQSPLHLDCSVHKEINNDITLIEYDLIVSMDMFDISNTSIDQFYNLKCKNSCYFNVRSTNLICNSRLVLTSDLIKYKDLITKSDTGEIMEIKEVVSLLTYFLQLLFRKENFRSGQVNILNRSLKNLPVIGLLPTGGGKSLTYQISALLQPGITMVIDPLKSLMKDQYDGLITSGIDCVNFINSSQSTEEKKIIEYKLESSQLLIVFLSPERLSISSFRTRLKNMHNHNVYFSYGVIDEVHCVSEWGHDFRFSYLHLGRNLYNYVRSKNNHISLFGLTATASFDVLADVERELSGNNSFELDSDVIVRSENTNRIEIQYKIERVPIEFKEDKWYDENKEMPDHLPKALELSHHYSTQDHIWSSYDSKSDFLSNYIDKISAHINHLQSESNIKYINDEFVFRQNSEHGVGVDYRVEMPNNFYNQKEIYIEAGIVFCPHVKSTGVSVNKNKDNLIEKVVDVGSFSGKDDDKISMKSIEHFRENKSPLMIATKAFGMGIDKPNVRFTINMNYSSSLEAFVQESGRSGRDKKLALSTILLSDYHLVKLNSSFIDNSFPFNIIKNKWFNKKDFDTIQKHYNKNISDQNLTYATPSNDIIKLHCSHDNKMFAFDRCNNGCSEFSRCDLKNVSQDTKGWKIETELLSELNNQDIKVSKNNFQYLNTDYQTVMYFFNNSFKGDVIEKTYMHKLLSTIELEVHENNNSVKNHGFLQALLDTSIDENIIVYIPYLESEYADLSKAIYRMCCIELIEDFTQDYYNKKFRIVSIRKQPGGYYDGLRRFLLRYFTPSRADLEMIKVNSIELKDLPDDKIRGEIYRCLSYLTNFVYDKISQKRKRAIDDMRSFCIEGLMDENWLVSNEKLKDYIYYYFNSKYAKLDYVAENGEPFSLLVDTDSGKKSDISILFKYLRVADDEDIVGVGTPLDNIKHLLGAVKLISRSLTDSNPTLGLLESYCLAYIGFKKNKDLKSKFLQKYSEGMIDFCDRIENKKEFWELFDKYNSSISKTKRIKKSEFDTLKSETSLLIHANILENITKNYLVSYE